MFDLCVSMFDVEPFQDELKVVTSPFPVCSELFTVVGQDGFNRDTVGIISDMEEEIDCGISRLVSVEFCPSEGSSGIATGHLIDSTDAFETADIEGVETDEITWVFRLNVSGLCLQPCGFELGESNDFTAFNSDPFESVFSLVKVISLHNSVNGGSSDHDSLSLKDKGDSLRSMAWILIEGGEDGFFNFDRGLVVGVWSSNAILETLVSFGTEVVTPLIEPCTRPSKQVAEFGNGFTVFKELDSLHSQVSIGRDSHGTSSSCSCLVDKTI